MSNMGFIIRIIDWCRYLEWTRFPSSNDVAGVPIIVFESDDDVDNNNDVVLYCCVCCRLKLFDTSCLFHPTDIRFLVVDNLLL